MSKTQSAIQEFHHLTDLIIHQSTGLTEMILRWKPSEQSWSIMEILSHVEEAVPYWLHELQRVVESPGTEWGRGLQHEGRLAAIAIAEHLNVDDVLQGIGKNKQMVKEVLGSIRDEDLAIVAPSRNPRFGTQPMAFIVSHLLIDHLQTHLNQIQRNLQQYEDANQRI